MKTFNKSKKGLKALAVYSGYAIFSLLFLISCDEELSIRPDAKITENMDNPQILENHADVASTIYVADLFALNNSGVSGTAIFLFADNQKFHAYVHATGLTPELRHAQHIHLLDACPTQQAAGEDGLLTIGDGLPFYGGVLVPLDNLLVPLTSQLFPLTNVASKVNYHAVTDLDQLISAISPADLNLAERTVVLHGAYVKDNQVVPPGTLGASYVGSLPIACGTISLK